MSEGLKKGLKITGIVAGGLLLAYGGYRVHVYLKDANAKQSVGNAVPQANLTSDQQAELAAKVSNGTATPAEIALHVAIVKKAVQGRGGVNTTTFIKDPKKATASRG